MTGAIAAALIAVALPSLASAGEHVPRQTFALTFTTERPAAPTGFSEAIDYVNPDDPAGKPPAAQRIVVRLADGTLVDTSAPQQCEAPDPALIAQGAGACPPGSVVGGGEVDLDTGLLGPARIIRSDVTLLNNEGEVIFLFEQRDNGTRVVSRAKVEGSSFTTEVPPIPGGPPDGFTAIDRVALEVDAVSRSRGQSTASYITTPRSCPEGGGWIHTGTFAYRDGVTQVVEGASPCERADSDPAAGDGRCSNRIRGTDSPDKLTGTEGSDRISGKPGGDRLKGKAGDDCLLGRGGRDRIKGGGGDDEIRGGRGKDRINGGGGADLVRGSRGGRDRIDCGPGRDVARVDAPRDRVRRCEKVKSR